MTVTHKKTKQKLTKIDRSRRKKKPIDKLNEALAKAAGTTVEAERAKLESDRSTPKPRQPGLPGVEEPHFAELAGYADELQLAKEEAKSAGENVKRKESALIAAMKKRGRTTYTDRGRNIYIELTTTEHAKVKQFNHEDEDKLA